MEDQRGLPRNPVEGERGIAQPVLDRRHVDPMADQSLDEARLIGWAVDREQRARHVVAKIEQCEGPAVEIAAFDPLLSLVGRAEDVEPDRAHFAEEVRDLVIGHAASHHVPRRETSLLEPVVQRDAAALQEPRRRFDADGGHDEIARQAPAGRRLDFTHPTAAMERGGDVVEQHAHPSARSMALEVRR